MRSRRCWSGRTWTRQRGGRIDGEMRRIGAGAAGERDAACEIELHAGTRAGRATIHDLRLEVGGRVAQGDHLLVNRLQDVWVLESKHVAEGVSINAQAEWAGFSGGQPYGMPPPIEQNRRHVQVLEQVFATGLVPLPKRLGLATIRPRIRPLVLISNGARITRARKAAQARVEGLDAVIKADPLASTINQDAETRAGYRTCLRPAQVSGSVPLRMAPKRSAALNRSIGSARKWWSRSGCR
jgi:hypothetical protein